MQTPPPEPFQGGDVRTQWDQRVYRLDKGLASHIRLLRDLALLAESLADQWAAEEIWDAVRLLEQLHSDLVVGHGRRPRRRS